MANVHRNFPSTILIGFVLLALFSNNAKTTAARFVPLATPQANEHSLLSPTCVKLGCNKNQQNNNLNPSLSHKVDHFLLPSNVNRILRLSPGGPDRHHN